MESPIVTRQNHAGRGKEIALYGAGIGFLVWQATRTTDTKTRLWLVAAAAATLGLAAWRAER